MVGKTITHYKVLKKIGQGGFGLRGFMWKGSVWAAYSDERHSTETITMRAATLPNLKEEIKK